MIDLTGKTAIVTGASRGIGAATAREFAKAGARVMLLARSGDAIDALVGEIRAEGGQASAMPCDVADYAAVASAVAATEAEFGPVDILINNAGILEPIGALVDLDPDDWHRVIDINVKGVFNGMRAVLPGMIARGAGTVITVGSGAAHSALEGWSHYCTSKAAALMLTRAGDKETGANGIVHINLSPGTVATEMQVVIKASGINPVSQLDPSIHIPADWPARAMLWLCGPDGAQYAGQEVSLRDEDIRRRAGLT